MSISAPELSTQIFTACQAGAAEIAAALGRTLGRQVTLAVAPAGPHDPARPGQDLAGPGLVLVIETRELAVAAILPAASGILPDWYVQTDATSRSKLATLAQEIGVLALPGSLPAEKCQAASAESMNEVLQQLGLGADSQLLPLAISGEGFSPCTLSLIWPVMRPDGLTAASDSISGDEMEGSESGGRTSSDDLSATAPSQEKRDPANQQPTAREGANGKQQATLERLPAYCRSLLRIRVPLTVTLAAKRQTVRSILELGPGSIIQFDKSCEEMLDVEVNGHLVGAGEAVKVGDKFGVRVASILLPDERFKPARGR